MAGWTITTLEGGGHQVSYLDDDSGDENMAGEFGPEVSIQEVIATVLMHAEPADWIITPTGEPLLVVDARYRGDATKK